MALHNLKNESINYTSASGNFTFIKIYRHSKSIGKSQNYSKRLIIKILFIKAQEVNQKSPFTVTLLSFFIFKK